MKFSLNTDFKPAGDQPQAIAALVANFKKGIKEQVLLGVTGSGKTFTMANVINLVQLPALVISHNKTLAAQLYQEFRSFFPQNAVSYFVSYYDYYQPEAYIPQTDTYIEKETDINQEIDKLRLATTTNILTRPDTIVVASVSCIYNLGSPQEYGQIAFTAHTGAKISRQMLMKRLIDLQYQRNEYGFHRSAFRVRGNMIDVFLAYEDIGVRFELTNDSITNIKKIDPLTGKTVAQLKTIVIYPAKHYLSALSPRSNVFSQIEKDLAEQVAKFKNQGKLLEAQRLSQRVNYDLEMIKEAGYVNGIENYSRYVDGRQSGDPPFSLLEYFNQQYKKQWLLFIDESHMTVPQLRGMYYGDLSRKTTLVNYGFRLPAAFDNRPLRFEEFLRFLPPVIYVSATPAAWEISRASQIGMVEQLVRTTGLTDPAIFIKPVQNQIDDLIKEILIRIKNHERVLVTTLTKRTAEALSQFLHKKGIKVQYLHSDVATLERTDILDDLRQGNYDVLVGINLLREGLDLPEVSLVAILDADKEGFLRSQVTLIQTMGRAARHVKGKVIMYADKMTLSMEQAIQEVGRRRQVQLEYNRQHRITPVSIYKPIRQKLVNTTPEEIDPVSGSQRHPKSLFDHLLLDLESLTPQDLNKLLKNLKKQMRFEADNLNFEMAAQIRDKIKDIRNLL